MPEKTICYTGLGAVVKNGNHTVKQFREVMKKNKNNIVLDHKSCANWRKEQKCRSCKIYNKLKLLPRKLTKKEESLYTKCYKCKNTSLKPCTVKHYMDFVGAKQMKCPESSV